MITSKPINQRHLSIGLLALSAASASLIVLVPVLWQVIILVALAAGLAGLCLVAYPKWAFYALTVYIPFEEFIEKWVPRGSLYEVVRFGGEALLIALLITVLLRRLIRRGFVWRVTPIDLPLFLFLVVATISCIMNSIPVTMGVLGIRPTIRYIMAFYILSQAGLSREFFERWLMMTFVVAAIVSLIGLLQTVIGAPLTNFLVPGDVIVGGNTVRIGLRHFLSPRTYIFSTLGRYDTLGTYLTFHLLMAVGWYAFAAEEIRRKIRIFIVIGLAALVMTFSRQSWLALACGLGTIALFARGGAFLKTRITFAVLIPTLILLTPILAQYGAYLGLDVAQATLLQRILEPFSENYFLVSRYSYGRLYVILEVGARVLNLSPFYGLGPGLFGSLAPGFFGVSYADLVGLPEAVAHFVNDVNWIVLLGQVGLFGLFFFVWMFVALLRSAVVWHRTANDPLIKGAALGFAGTVIALMVLGFFGPNFEVRQHTFYFWSVGGMLVALHRKRQPS